MAQLARLYSLRPEHTRVSRSHRLTPVGSASAPRVVNDPRGISWEIRDVWTDTGHALLFQCRVPGMRPGIHAVSTLASAIDDEDLVAMIPVADD